MFDPGEPLLGYISYQLTVVKQSGTAIVTDVNS